MNTARRFKILAAASLAALAVLAGCGGNKTSGKTEQAGAGIDTATALAEGYETDFERSISGVWFGMTGYSGGGNFVLDLRRTKTGALAKLHLGRAGVYGIELNTREWADFINALNGLSPDTWKKEYDRSEDSDTEWKLQISTDEPGGGIVSRGAYEYPPNWDELKKLSDGLTRRMTKDTAASDALSNPDSIEMVFVKGGTVRFKDEGKNIQAAAGDFYMAKYEVTQGLWKAVMGGNPSAFRRNDNLPVEMVRWDDVQKFIKKLNAKTGKNYRLPTEVEWRYADRGGKRGGSDIDSAVWNSGYDTHPVGMRQANALGIYDMDGNVEEWAGDAHDGSDRLVFLGGEGGKTSLRRGFDPKYALNFLGFRLALSSPLSKDEELSIKKRAEKRDTASGKNTGGEVNNIDMVSVEGGTFMMGCTDNERQRNDCYSDEKPAHKVTVGDFQIGRREVTQGLWKAVMGGSPSFFQGGDSLPVETVSWIDAREFIRRLNARTGKAYRLPTEAEWEYAARGGNKSRGYEYSGSDTAGGVVWYDGNSAGKTRPAGAKRPNELGIYDMSGNVYEWVNDRFGAYGPRERINPTGFPLGYNRVIRGGGWGRGADESRVSYRDSEQPDSRGNLLGFRLALTPQGARPVNGAVKIGGEMTDRRDGRKYRTVEIAGKTWMAENLNYRMESAAGVCYQNNPANCAKYGMLYTLDASMTACPPGWRLPANSEWESLAAYAGGGPTAGTLLKSETGWRGAGSGTDEYGFAALPGGSCNREGTRFYQNAGEDGYWWSAKKNKGDYSVWVWGMHYNDRSLHWQQSDDVPDRYSIRCVQP